MSEKYKSNICDVFKETVVKKNGRYEPNFHGEKMNPFYLTVISYPMDN